MRIRLTHDKDGVVLADSGGKPSPAGPVEAYVAEAFGEHLAGVRKAMEELAARYEPEELNRIGFRLYEHFRPEVPADVRGWGAKGMLDLSSIRSAESDAFRLGRAMTLRANGSAMRALPWQP
jgi:hypothetical protein